MARLLAAVTGVALLAAIAAFGVAGSRPYRLSVLLPAATNLVVGTPIRMQGIPAGQVEHLSVQGDQARIEFTVETERAPLHEGATAKIGWKSLLGERIFEVTDGPTSAVAIPDGGMITGQMPAPVEMDQVLAMLDPPTRARLASLVRALDGTVSSSAADLNATLRTSGPALDALGNVLRGVGTDGEAIRQLVTKLDELVGTVAARDEQLEGIVNHLDNVSATVAAKRERLRQVLARTPGTLDRATSVLGQVPPTVDAVEPLLTDLRPVTERLRPVAGNLRPVLADLRPAVADLRPTLDAASDLLTVTPGTLDSLRDTLPDTRRALIGFTPAFDFLRPYTPELVGWMANWASAMANYDANGHYARGMVQTGLESANANPGGLTGPGVVKNEKPLPGEAAGQPWPDAFGTEMR